MINNSFDCVVVGAGAAGCVMSARLSDNPAVRVALIEAGCSDASGWVSIPAGLVGTVPTQRMNWAFETVLQPGLNGRRGYQPRRKVMGGSSSATRWAPAGWERMPIRCWTLCCVCVACSACAWWTLPSCRPCLLQHQCAQHHDRREGGRPDEYPELFSTEQAF